MASKGDSHIAFKIFWRKLNADNELCLKYTCKLCGVERLKNKSGFTNLNSHLDDKHKNWKKVVEQTKSSKGVKGSMDKFLKRDVDDKYKNIYRWINWIIKGKHPFSYVENIYARKYSKLTPICKSTLMKYMEAVYERVKHKISKLLPETFGGLFDGWTCVREHYLAFFATWVTKEGNVVVRLLCCGVQDLPDEVEGENADDFGFSAADIADYILFAALMRYKKSFEHLEFLGGDNCSVNKALADGITQWFKDNDKPLRVVCISIFAFDTLI